MTHKLNILLLCTALLLPLTVQAQGAGQGLIDVSIRVFDTPPDNATPQVEAANNAPSPLEVSLAEIRYFPMLLRYRLEASKRFGAVRVLPVLDNGAELMIEGAIIFSDENRLELAITANDSTGRSWLNKTYSGTAQSSEALNGNKLTDDDFHAVYSAIIQDLLTMLDTLQPEQLERISTVSLLRYGLALVPPSFAPYLEQSANGQITVRRLPARNDPLLTRIEAIREREYLFIDVVDEEYSRFYADIKPVYDMWREYRREQIQSAASYTERNTAKASQFRKGSYYALQESYNNYRWVKLQEIYLNDLKQGFANETEPTEIELSDSLYRLTGTLEQQYREWRNILAELYQLETEE